MRFTTLVIFFIGLFNFHGMSQNAGPDTLPASSTVTPSARLIPASQNKLHVNFMVGSEFWSAPGYGSGLGTMFMTGITYPVGKRFNVGGGIGVISTTPIGVKHTTGEYFGNPNSTNALVYVTGQYLLSQRVTVSGTLFKEFSIFNNSPEDQRFQKNLPQGGYMKVSYKINDFMQIEAGIGYSRGYYNPYNTSFMGSSMFDNSPFPFRNH
jgi:hypothetical protein